MTKGSAAVSGGGLFDAAEEQAAFAGGYDPRRAEPPSDWPDFSNGVETEYCCPRCSYQWRGKPKPSAEDAELG